MESIEEIRRHYRLGSVDEENRKELAEILLPHLEVFADEFYQFLLEDSYTAAFFHTEEAVRRRKETIKVWLKDLLTAHYNNAYVRRLEKIGKVHVKIGLKGHYVNASMHFVRSFCLHRVFSEVSDPLRRESLLETLDKILDVNLDIMTGSYREEELKRVFLSHEVESLLVRWAERILHGLNLILMIALLAMAAGVAVLLGSDILYGLTANFETGVIKALGSLLILWMMIELLHTQVKHLRGEKFHVRIFLELALVAFIRKLFVASIEEKDPLTIGLLLAGLLVLGLIFYFLGKSDAPVKK